jgi:hypothetical protein
MVKEVLIVTAGDQWHNPKTDDQAHKRDCLPSGQVTTTSFSSIKTWSLDEEERLSSAILCSPWDEVGSPSDCTRDELALKRVTGIR